jgi:hypothetical protein
MLVAIRAINVLLCLFACSCTNKVLSSVCLPNVRSDVDGITLGVLLQPKLPEGASVSGSWSSERPERRIVQYRNRVYEVTARPDGNGSCFDFNPPIPLTGEKPNTAKTPGVLAERGSADRLAALLSDYWYVVVILGGLLFYFLKTLKGTASQHQSAISANSPQLADALPELAEELETLLKSEGENNLAAQVPGLRIVDRCRCGDDFCATFHVQPKPEGSYGPGHRNVELKPKTGMLILDVVDEKIAAVEVLYRDEIRQKLHTLLP